MDEILARAGIFQGVEPSAVAALTKQLQPVDFPADTRFSLKVSRAIGCTSSSRAR
ncbi:transcriptional regulator, Crp/Fnr family protein [Mycobacterium kansasii 824]|nr:transcriptional regulator, Crp/Fnr family protein [Mycobacterium kansasii 824]